MQARSAGKRIPSLDGIRAVSILLVLYGHLSGTRGFPNPMHGGYGNALGDVAHLGVLVFFVISGFLITSLLMSEREKTGTISLGKFYLRRVLRIFPAFYALILALGIATWLGWVDLRGIDFAYALTYTVNYYPHHPWQIGHLWSLSVEEQFYLLWPLTLLALRQRRALIVAVFAILAGPLVRAGIREWLFHVDPNTPLAGMSIFPAMCDYLATGCALALLRPWLLKQQWYLRLTATPWLALAIPLVLLINCESDWTLVELLFSPVMNICIALLLEASTRHTESLAGRFLNCRPMVSLGVLSYSLYLWQQPFLNRNSDTFWTTFPQNLAFAFGCALLSYFLIEHAFLGLRKRLERADTLPLHSRGVAGLLRAPEQTKGGTAVAMPPSEST